MCRWILAPAAAAAILLALVVAGRAAAQEPARLVIDQGGIVVIDDAGGERHVVARDTLRARFSEPRWAPDGRRIVATRATGDPDRGEPRSELVLLDPADPGRVVVVPGSQGLRDAAFSPDAEQLVATRARGRPEQVRQDLVVLPAGGGAPRQLTTGGYDTGPTWSPDGATIAFTRESGSAGGAPRLRVLAIGPDGADLRTLVGNGFSPAWSPDGARVAFASTRDGNGQTCFHDCFPNGELYVAAANGADQRRLTRTPADEGAPAWSPDGTRLAFSSDRHYPASRSAEIFAIDPDGGCVTQLTFAAAGAASPAWQPGASPPRRGPCGARVVAYLDEVDTSVVPVRDTAALYPGRAFEGMLLTGAERGFLIYEDCDRPDPGRCPGEVQVQIRPVCARHPARFDVPSSRVQLMRGALVVSYDDTIDVHTGGTTITVYGQSEAQARRFVAALQPLTGPSRLGRPLPAPRFGRRLLSRLKRSALVRRGGLGVSRAALVRSDARVLRALRRFGPVAGRQPACAR